MCGEAEHINPSAMMPFFSKLHECRYRSSVRAAFFVIAILAGIAAIVSMMPDHLRSGQVVDEFGKYISPRRRYRVTISETAHGTIRLTRSYPTKRLRFFTVLADDTPTEFEAEREWFFCVDEYERLWLFIGKWDPRWGETQRLPSGGYWPHIQSVLLDGFWFTPSGLLRGSNVVSATGDWAGVPGEFFNRIPAKRDAVWGEIPAIPDTAPPLTQTQRQAAESLMVQKRKGPYAL